MSLHKPFFLLVLTTVCLFLVACGNNEMGKGPSPSPPVNIQVETVKPINTPAEQPTPSPSPVVAGESLKYNEYQISVEIDPSTRMVKGISKITGKNRGQEDIDKTYVHLNLNAFKKFQPDPFLAEFRDRIYEFGQDFGYLDILAATINGQETTFLSGKVLTVDFPEPVKPGDIYELTLQFEAYVPKINHRTGANDNAIWLGGFFPTVAVYDQNGWHTEPYYPLGDPYYTNISNYTVKVTVPEDYVVVGTGDEVSSTVSDGKKSTTFSAKLVRDFALALSPDYKCVSMTNEKDVTVNLYYYSQVKNPEWLVSKAAEAVRFYSEQIGSYPYTSVNIIEAGLPLNVGAEHSQMAFVDSTKLKSDGAVNTITHEIAHQWFYNIVGNNPYTEPWLDEGLCLFLQNWCLKTPETFDEDAKRDFTNLKLAMVDISDKNSLRSIDTFSSWSEYYRVVYQKPYLMIYDLKRLMGDEKFESFLKKYYAETSFKLSNKQVFFTIAEEIYGRPLDEFFNYWLSGMPGTFEFGVSQ